MMNKRVAFPSTRWTRVAHASDPHHPRAQAAFAELFQLYWYPMYAFLRFESGCDHEKAEDLLQAFFLYAYEHRTFGKADREEVRFRTFVLGRLKNFLIDEYRHTTAAKRGGSLPHLDIDSLEAEARYAADLADERFSPEKLFERKLALEIVNGAMAELESEATEDGKSAIFAAVRQYLDGEDEGATEGYRAISVRLNIPVGTLKSHTHRFRNRLRELLRDCVDQIVASEDDVKSELQALEEAL
jgi:RNA polymerase sigma-70 factor (ECF subfamily)